MLNVSSSMLHALPVAYLDGGTGSLILQGAIAGALTAGYVLKTQWYALKARFSRKSAPVQTPPSNVK